ncbi:ZBED5 protein, partial [Atractosteus spatula]|nr:ZBED5 protein [Atractosteus spatula]
MHGRGPTIATVFFCSEVLTNSSVKPAHLQRHMSTKHRSCVGKTVAFFQLKLSETYSKLAYFVLKELKLNSESYFSDIKTWSAKLYWVRNPFTVTESSSSLPARLREHLMDVSLDRGLKMKHAEKTLTQFRCDVEKEYPELG